MCAVLPLLECESVNLTHENTNQLLDQTLKAEAEGDKMTFEYVRRTYSDLV